MTCTGTDFSFSQSAVQSVSQHQFNVSEIGFMSVSLYETDIRKVIPWRSFLRVEFITARLGGSSLGERQKGNWKTQRSWKEDRSRDLDFVWSVGFYFDREEEGQHTGQAGF